jgi:hypothetical protein
MAELSFDLKMEVIAVIMDTGFAGSAEDYIQKFYGKEFDALSVAEAELIVQVLKDKKGCLWEEPLND